MTRVPKLHLFSRYGMPFVGLVPYYQYQEYRGPKLQRDSLYLTGEFLEGVIKDAGFVDVQVKYQKLYTGTWAYGLFWHTFGS